MLQGSQYIQRQYFTPQPKLIIYHNYSIRQLEHIKLQPYFLYLTRKPPICKYTNYVHTFKQQKQVTSGFSNAHNNTSILYHTTNIHAIQSILSSNKDKIHISQWTENTKLYSKKKNPRDNICFKLLYEQKTKIQLVGIFCKFYNMYKKYSHVRKTTKSNIQLKILKKQHMGKYNGVYEKNFSEQYQKSYSIQRLVTRADKCTPTFIRIITCHVIFRTL
eukprot:TRINITY_DN3419_c0_g1_i2.p1 TRINITY_DN3419_c0_g1~~TRINITY_DN3419_c0_g1_i2.p1  ORF type:complete len:240 (+),score=-15.91 TRINITY_DN3419_c0_g1_i2:67-720(+)